MRSAHINADYSAQGNRGSSDHDPQVARFQSRPGLSIADARVTEGAQGSTAALTFPVTLSRPMSVPLTVCATALPGTAWPIADFDPLISCRTVPAGQTATSFTVTVRGDNRREADETLSVKVTGVGAVRAVDPVATGTIVNDD
jgi:hypothetical protein